MFEFCQKAFSIPFKNGLPLLHLIKQKVSKKIQDI
jgi:hypothetical protein